MRKRERVIHRAVKYVVRVCRLAAREGGGRRLLPRQITPCERAHTHTACHSQRRAAESRAAAPQAGPRAASLKTQRSAGGVPQPPLPSFAAFLLSSILMWLYLRARGEQVQCVRVQLCARQ